jgi:hypothetical protein
MMETCNLCVSVLCAGASRMSLSHVVSDTRPRARVLVVAEACWGGSACVQVTVAIVIGEIVRA